MFSVPIDQLASEAGSDIVELNGGLGRLALLAEYLYGSNESPIDAVELHNSIRLSPSIIARSESELLGISSPRFAFRAYIHRVGFVTIRRRRCTHDRIFALHGDKEYLPDLISRVSDGIVGNRTPEWTEEDSLANWIADCMLAVPMRLLTDDLKVITCDLSQDYGEKYNEPLVPFVTHVEFGGGLCAQAACFMVLCLVEHPKIVGISEITYQAAQWAKSKTINAIGEESESATEDLLRIRGLTPLQIESFFNSQKELSAQLQCLSTLKANAKSRICKALRVYVKNAIPVIQIVSLARMLGYGQNPPAPIVILSDKVVHGEYNRLPMGTRDNLDLSEEAGHCIVVIGCNDKGFLINDPASFPFIPCTDEQITNICAPSMNEANQTFQEREEEASNNESVANWYSEELRQRENRIKRVGQTISKSSPTPNMSMPAAPHLFAAISVTGKGVELGLLYYGKTEKERVTHWHEQSGLFSMIDCELRTGECFGYVDADLSREKSEMPCLNGEYYLVTVSIQNNKTIIRSSNTEFEHLRLSDSDHIRALKQGVYWVHFTAVQALGASASISSNAVYFWDASKRSVSGKNCVVAMFLGEPGAWQWLSRLEG
jgi:hypothetical protein